MRDYGRERMGEGGGEEGGEKRTKERMEEIEENVLFKHSSSCRPFTMLIFMLL